MLGILRLPDAFQKSANKSANGLSLFKGVLNLLIVVKQSYDAFSIQYVRSLIYYVLIV